MNDLIINIEAQLLSNRFDKNLLIEEAFVLWYVLVEGIECENFSKEGLVNLLATNYRIYKARFSNDAEYNFIMGWMITVTYWYFPAEVNEDDGDLLLMKAYRSNPQNSLFKWALRDKLELSMLEIANLKVDIWARFKQLYNHGSFIENYFLDVV